MKRVRKYPFSQVFLHRHARINAPRFLRSYRHKWADGGGDPDMLVRVIRGDECLVATMEYLRYDVHSV